MRRTDRWQRPLLFLLLAAAAPVRAQPGLPASAPQISVLTFGPGRVYWERFGHNAILVRDPATGSAIDYNYGIFDFQQKNFFLNFARGVMRYRLDAEPLDADLAFYASEGRSISEQTLNLSPAQAEKLAAFLAWNARPENAQYRYDYFVNNCSTKVRDALNRALGGALERQLTARPAAHTYRFEAIRLIAPDRWLMLGMDAALGPAADRSLNLWQESFIPMVLEHALRGVTVTAGGRPAPLVRSQRLLVPGQLPLPPRRPPELTPWFLALGLLWGVGVWSAARSTGGRRRAGVLALAGVLLVACGLGGVVLAAMWAFTEHWATWGNENLLLFDPLCWLLLPATIALARGLVPSRFGRGLALVVAALAAASLVVRWLPGAYQANLAWIALLLPPHLVLAWALARRAAPRSG